MKIASGVNTRAWPQTEARDRRRRRLAHGTLPMRPGPAGNHESSGRCRVVKPRAQGVDFSEETPLDGAEKSEWQPGISGARAPAPKIKAPALAPKLNATPKKNRGQRNLRSRRTNQEISSSYTLLAGGQSRDRRLKFRSSKNNKANKEAKPGE
jgi:hypothetical protein